MTQSNPTIKWQTKTFELTRLEQAIPKAFSVDIDKQSSKQTWLYDSFNRSLSSNGLSLIRSAGKFSLVNATDLCSDAITSNQTVRHQRPVFYWDFEDTHLQQALRSHLKYRAAQPLTSIHLVIRELCVRNKDAKIVLRLSAETATVDEKEILTTITAIPLLGYEEEALVIATQLSQIETFKFPKSSFAQYILEHADQAKVPLSPKDMIALTPQQSVQSAVTQIAISMLQVARQNEGGIIEDVDTEFLHDYRVALRKLRSVITLVKGAYPKEETQQLKDIFGQLARATNRLRDLDVYLLQETTYRNELPTPLQPGLDRLFKDFRAERRRVIRKIQNHFQSAEYQQLISEQQQWFSEQKQPKGPRATFLINEVASKEILKHYKLIRKEGMAITPDTPDEAVHELRIECKKLRYLLELFASIYRPEDLKAILKRLRGLQNVLGDFNDYSVQTESMLEYLNQAKDLDKNSAAAVGGLIAVLHDRQLQARNHVTERFHEFSDSKMNERFKRLFTPEKGRK